MIEEKIIIEYIFYFTISIMENNENENLLKNKSEKQK